MDNITYDDFKKLDLRLGEIKAVDLIEGADKIYKLTVDLGTETRVLVAGVKLHAPSGGSNRAACCWPRRTMIGPRSSF